MYENRIYGPEQWACIEIYYNSPEESGRNEKTKMKIPKAKKGVGIAECGGWALLAVGIANGGH